MNDLPMIIMRGLQPEDAVIAISAMTAKLAGSAGLLVIDFDKVSCRNLSGHFRMQDEVRSVSMIERNASLPSHVIRSYLNTETEGVGLVFADEMRITNETMKRLFSAYQQIIVNTGMTGGRVSIDEDGGEVRLAEVQPEVQSSSGQDDTVLKDVMKKLRGSKEMKKLIESAELPKMERREIETRVVTAVRDILDEMKLSEPERGGIIERLLHNVVGLGAIEGLLSDAEVSEIMVNSPNEIFVERNGKIEKTGLAFENNAEVMRVVDRIVGSVGRRVDEASPVVDARLPNGSRVHVIIPPLALRGPTLTIRKFSRSLFSMDDLIRLGTLSLEMSSFLKLAVKKKLNILISGGTGSGKTTLLGLLSSFISHTERLITIEDSAELSLKQPHVVRLESRPPNIEGKGEVSIRDLVKASLRMRPDRMIVGECRGGEALDMLQAMNTGHDGSLTTIHANSCRDSLSRLQTLVLFAGFDLPMKAVREQITSAIDLIVQIKRFKDGSRKITSITEVTGLEGDVISLQELFVYSGGEFASTGLRPKFMEDAEEK